MQYWIDEQSGIRMCKPNYADEWLELIWEIGVDYDGYSDAQHLMELIDEIIEYSQNARKCLQAGQIFPPENER